MAKTLAEDNTVIRNEVTSGPHKAIYEVILVSPARMTVWVQRHELGDFVVGKFTRFDDNVAQFENGDTAYCGLPRSGTVTFLQEDFESYEPTVVPLSSSNCVYVMEVKGVCCEA